METNLPVEQHQDYTEPIHVEASRAAEEVKGAIIVAKKFPRDINDSFQQVITSCERISLAKQAIYSYPRGGKTVSGPSIRLAEVLARAWGNVQYGIRELCQKEGESVVEAFCWDVEANVRVTRQFKQLHKRFTKADGLKDLEDPRDVYEIVANMGTRRLRACILQVIPGDVIEAAVDRCKLTLTKGDKRPLQDKVRELITGLSKVGVSKEMVEQRLGHGVDIMNDEEAVEYVGILRSMLDGQSKREDWFKVPNANNGLTTHFLTPKGDTTKEVEKKPYGKEPAKNLPLNNSKQTPKSEAEIAWEKEPAFDAKEF